MAKFQVDGLDDVLDMLKKVENLPQKCVNRSAKAGASILLKEAKANAPVKDRYLINAMYLKAEKTKIKCKKVYQVSFRPEANDKLVKVSKKNKRSYYPSSQEYGFITRNGKKVKGKHFLRRAADSKASEVEKVMVEKLTEEIDKL